MKVLTLEQLVEDLKEVETAAWGAFTMQPWMSGRAIWIVCSLRFWEESTVSWSKRRCPLLQCKEVNTHGWVCQVSF